MAHSLSINCVSPRIKLLSVLAGKNLRDCKSKLWWLFATPWIVACQNCPWAFSRQEHWSELPCSPPREREVLKYLLWELGRGSGSKIKKTVVTPYYLAPRKFLTLSFFHAEPPTIHNYSSGFPTSALVPEEVSAHGSPLSQLRFFLSACLSLLFWWKWFVFWLPFSDRFKKKCWVFQFVQVFIC